MTCCDSLKDPMLLVPPTWKRLSKRLQRKGQRLWQIVWAFAHSVIDRHKDNMEGLRAIKQFKKSVSKKAEEGEKQRKFKTPKQKGMQ